MTQEERRIYLIQELLKERGETREIPQNEEEQRTLLRGLMNERPAADGADDFIKIQDVYLATENIARMKAASDPFDWNKHKVAKDMYIWRGDITTLPVDAIVNAANSGLTGCYIPNHRCIDNAIHTYAGIQLRTYCNYLMLNQGHEEPTGQAKITPGFNLPCKYVIHTVGPIVEDKLTQKHCDLLASCYRSCLTVADEKKLDSIAFCCISTGVFHFPNDKAAHIAVKTVQDYKQQTGSKIKVVFNVFTAQDEAIYKNLF